MDARLPIYPTVTLRKLAKCKGLSQYMLDRTVERTKRSALQTLGVDFT